MFDDYVLLNEKTRYTLILSKTKTAPSSRVVVKSFSLLKIFSADFQQTPAAACCKRRTQCCLVSAWSQNQPSVQTGRALGMEVIEEEEHITRLRRSLGSIRANESVEKLINALNLSRDVFKKARDGRECLRVRVF